MNTSTDTAKVFEDLKQWIARAREQKFVCKSCLDDFECEILRKSIDAQAARDIQLSKEAVAGRIACPHHKEQACGCPLTTFVPVAQDTPIDSVGPYLNSIEWILHQVERGPPYDDAFAETLPHALEGISVLCAMIRGTQHGTQEGVQAQGHDHGAFQFIWEAMDGAARVAEKNGDDQRALDLRKAQGLLRNPVEYTLARLADEARSYIDIGWDHNNESAGVERALQETSQLLGSAIPTQMEEVLPVPVRLLEDWYKMKNSLTRDNTAQLRLENYLRGVMDARASVKRPTQPPHDPRTNPQEGDWKVCTVHGFEEPWEESESGKWADNDCGHVQWLTEHQYILLNTEKVRHHG